MGNLAVYKEASNSTTRLTMMNLGIHGIEGVLGSENADTSRRDLQQISTPITCWPIRRSTILTGTITTRTCGGSAACLPRETRLQMFGDNLDLLQWNVCKDGWLEQAEKSLFFDPGHEAIDIGGRLYEYDLHQL